MKKSTIGFVTLSGFIAAAYAALTMINPLSFGSIQLRVSELFVVLATITPAAIPGLTLGCLIGNLVSFMPLDFIFGTLATFIAAVLAYLFKNVKVMGVPLLSAVFPIVLNGAAVSLQFMFYAGNYGFYVFITGFITVALGEAAICLVGLTFYKPLKNIFARLA